MRLYTYLSALSVAGSCVARSQHVLASQQVSWKEFGTEARIQDATESLLFSSIASLLQQWPNTRYRNGHTIIKGTIPKGTVLYHARGDKDLPLLPEWTAFNVEHSYLICPGVCWMHTLAIEEDLNVMYFDGSSASNSYLGHQDTQDVLLWGRIRREMLLAERERIDSLCKWGEPYGIDAIVRMEPGFEVMLCDFRKKTRLVSSIHIMHTSRHPPSLNRGGSTLKLRQFIRLNGSDAVGTLQASPPTPPSPRRPRPTSPIPPGWKGPLRQSRPVSVSAVEAATWNNFYPGEVRTKLDYSRMISFYDPIYTSLLEAREGVPRSKHRLLNISSEDLHLAIQQLRTDLGRTEEAYSGVDWSALTRGVMDRYGERLYQLKQILGKSNVQKKGTVISASKARSQIFTMLTPYMVYGALPAEDVRGSPRNTSWLEPINQHCATTITNGISDDTLTRSEKLIKHAVEGVLQHICTTLTDIWADAFSVTEVVEEEVEVLLPLWRKQLADLMAWLDWDMWDTCEPACLDEEFCYISMWPWAMSLTEEDVDTIDMTPHCIDRENGDLGPWDE